MDCQGERAIVLGLGQLFRSRPERTAGRRLYAAVVAQARHSRFYEEWGVPDTPTGRFDLIALHCFLVMHRLKGDGASRPVAQSLCDAVVEDMDRNLREMGTGDLSVGKKVKRLMEGFYGRVGAYEEALQSDEEMLISTLKRNLYAAAVPDEDGAAQLAQYVRREAAALSDQPIERFGAGQVSFGAPPSRSHPAAQARKEIRP
jgi:cytochrome b pre-mRNA-processing protein 3